MALIVSRIEPSVNSDGSFSIVLQAEDGELQAVIPQNFVLPLQSALQRHLVQQAFDQSSKRLATTGVSLPEITIDETTTAAKGGETNLCSRTPQSGWIVLRGDNRALRELRDRIDESFDTINLAKLTMTADRCIPPVGHRFGAARRKSQILG
jgi:hypothetical protein